MPFPLRAPISVRVATQSSHTVDGSMGALLTALMLEGGRAERQGASLRFRLSPFRRPVRWFGDPLMFVTSGAITVSHSEAETSLAGWVSFTDILAAWAGVAAISVGFGVPWWGAMAFFLAMAFFAYTVGQNAFEQWASSVLREAPASQNRAAVAP